MKTRNGQTGGSAPRPLILSGRAIGASIVLFLVVAVCIRLGLWQLDRRAQRLDHNAVLEARSLEAPVVDPVRLRDTTGLLYRSATLHGRFDHDRAIALPGRSYGGAPGVHLLAPFLPDGSAAAILVNRGWVPAADGASIDFDYFTADTTTRVSGTLLPFPHATDSRGAVRNGGNTGGDPVPFRRLWYGVDELALRRQYPYTLLDAQLQLAPDPARTEAPLPLPAPTLDEGPHLGYAVQWFSFAAIALIGWIVLVFRGRPADERARVDLVHE